MEASFEGFSIKNIPRGENEHADLLAKSAAHGLPLPSKVFFETIKAPSVELMERAVLTISPVHSEDWRTEIVSFLEGNCISDDEAYIKRMEARTRHYVIVEGELYKQGVFSTLLKCLSRTEGQKLRKEIHAGLCGAHIWSKPLLGKVFRQGFYWPKATSDAANLVQKCENCQRPKTTFVSNSANPAHLAITKVGPRFIRPTSTSAREFKIHCSSGGTLFKVDRSYTFSYNHFDHGSKVLLAEYCLSLQCAKGHYS
jgi:hypothetical protein